MWLLMNKMQQIQRWPDPNEPSRPAALARKEALGIRTQLPARPVQAETLKIHKYQLPFIQRRCQMGGIRRDERASVTARSAPAFLQSLVSAGRCGQAHRGKHWLPTSQLLLMVFPWVFSVLGPTPSFSRVLSSGHSASSLKVGCSLLPQLPWNRPHHAPR